MISIDEIVEIVKNPKDTHALKYLQIDLAQNAFEEERLVACARKEGIAHRLGYLAEVTAQSLERTHLADPAALYSLARVLFVPPASKQYLNPNLPEFGKRIFEKRTDPLADKWGMVGFFSDEEMDSWMTLYLSNDQAIYTTRRH